MELPKATTNDTLIGTRYLSAVKASVLAQEIELIHNQANLWNRESIFERLEINLNHPYLDTRIIHLVKSVWINFKGISFFHLDRQLIVCC